MATEQAGVNDMPDAWEREAWVAVTVTGGAQVAAWRPRPWLPGYLFGSHFFIVDGCGYLFRVGFWEIFEIFFWGGKICQLEIGVAGRGCRHLYRLLAGNNFRKNGCMEACRAPP